MVRVTTVLEIREKSGNLRKIEESQGILLGCLDFKKFYHSSGPS